MEKAIWTALGAPDTETPECLGRLGGSTGDVRSEPLAIAQLLLLYDAALVSAHIDGTPAAAQTARDAAVTLLNQATAKRR